MNKFLNKIKALILFVPGGAVLLVGTIIYFVYLVIFNKERLKLLSAKLMGMAMMPDNFKTGIRKAEFAAISLSIVIYLIILIKVY